MYIAKIIAYCATILLAAPPALAINVCRASEHGNERCVGTPGNLRIVRLLSPHSRRTIPSTREDEVLTVCALAAALCAPAQGAQRTPRRV